MKTGAPGISAFGGAWTGGVTGGAEGGFSFTSGLGCGPCISGLGGGVGPPAGEAGAGLIPSFMGRLEGMGPPDDGVDPVKSRKAGTLEGLFDGVDCGPAGGILICGLIGLDELGKFDGLVGSAMWSRV